MRKTPIRLYTYMVLLVPRQYIVYISIRNLLPLKNCHFNRVLIVFTEKNGTIKRKCNKKTVKIN